MYNEFESLESLIDFTRDNNSTSINFNNLKLEIVEELPSIFFELENLEVINFGDKYKFYEIPTTLYKFQNLKDLTIASAEFEIFPAELMQLKTLTRLTFDSDRLISIPKEISEWNGLEYLNIGGCENLSNISGLPTELDYLYLNGKSLGNMPDELFKLKKIRKLVASNFNLSEWPNKLFELTGLTALFLGYNKIKTIPRDILKLKKLEDFWLLDNEIKRLPAFVSQLKNLEFINLRRNKLTTIPKSIAKLRNLKRLDIGDNLLKKIPEVVFKIENLEKLMLSNFEFPTGKSKNKITIIPSELLGLKKLDKFEIYGLEIENIPPEIVSDGLDSIKNFLQSKLEADEEDYLYEAKMVVVGRGDVGKTVLTKKLSISNYSLSKSHSTKGINVLKNPFEFRMNGLKNRSSFRFNIWDFGGQEKYDATHQLFITRRSVYLFLTEARDESNYQDVYYWLNTISLFSYNSPVIVILSKYDERKKLLPESVYKEKFRNIVQFVDVSCADGYEHTIESLKDAIKTSVKLLPQTKLTLSNHWVAIRNELERLSNHKDFIDYSEYLKICSDNKLDKIKADFLSDYLNDLGVIVHHSDDLLLKNTIFLNTDYCVDGMYKVLDDEKVFINKGKFILEDLENIWKDKRFDGKHAELIKLMENFGLCFQLTDRSAYIVPELLPLEKPSGLDWKYRDSLQMEYQYEFMPAGIVSRLIVKSHSVIKENYFWKYGVILRFDDTEALIEEDYINNKIRISLLGGNKKGLLSAIRLYIDDVHKDFDKSSRLVYKVMIPCSCAHCEDLDKPHFYKFDVLKKHEQNFVKEIPCDYSSKMVNITKLINDIQISNPSDYFETDNDLRGYISDLLSRVLEHEMINKGGYVNFWRDKKTMSPKNEVEIHPYICNTLDNHCRVRGINLSREVEESNGNVDILFSCTTMDKKVLKVCVEVKKAHHRDVVTAVKTQLPEYMNSAKTNSGIYLIVWYKNNSFKMPTKYNTKEELINKVNLNKPSNLSIDTVVIDCTKKRSPSKKP